MMTHKGYTGVLQIDEDSGVLYGDVIGLQDIITFQGETVAEARQAFRDSVEDYLEFCASRGEPPEKPFSGRFLVRVPSALHRALVERAAAQGVSLNALAERALTAEVGPIPPEPDPPAKSQAKPRRPKRAAAKTEPASP